MKLSEVLSKTIEFFKNKNFETPRLDAELIIAHALKIPRIQLYVKYDTPLNESEINLCRDYVKRRSNGEPVAYIVEEKGFYGSVFTVRPGVLIPRPETELIVDAVLSDNKNVTQSVRILELGAGSGCIGLSILKNSTNTELVAIEKSELAFNILKENTQKLDLANRAQLIHQDVHNIDWANMGNFQYIISNPPYIAPTDSAVETNVRKFEPNEALFADDDGYRLLKDWSSKTRPLLLKNGLMLFEMGHTQGAEMQKHFSTLFAPTHVEIIKDLSGLDRVIKGRA